MLPCFEQSPIGVHIVFDSHNVVIRTCPKNSDSHLILNCMIRQSVCQAIVHRTNLDFLALFQIFIVVQYENSSHLMEHEEY